MNDQPNGQPKPRPLDMSRTLIITLDSANMCQVSGPIQNLLFCLGLIEMAKLTLTEVAKNSDKRVQIAAPGVPV